jgi:hypothetical protein
MKKEIRKRQMIRQGNAEKDHDGNVPHENLRDSPVNGKGDPITFQHHHN